MNNIWRQDPTLFRPFSLYVFHGLLLAVHTMHQKEWTHRDLHGKFFSHLVVYYYICFDQVLM